jgi:membrane fusion protein (multidrug efflux system)
MFLKFICSSFFLISIISCGSKTPDKKAGPANTPGKQPPQKVEVVVITPQKLDESIEVPGTLTASESTEIHPEVSGRLIMLNVREGNYVSKGSVIAKLYDADLQAQLRKSEAQLSIANQTAKRLSQLLNIQGISKQDYDMAVLNANNIRADIEITKTNIARTVVRSPFSGKLGLKEISTGAYVTPQTIIAVIKKTSDMKLDFSVPEKYIGDAKNGVVVYFHVEGSDVRHAAKISATESGITENTRNLMVRATIVGNDPSLVPGAFAKVILDFAPNNTALMVPSQAIIPQARGKKVVVYKNGIAKFTDVVTGVRDSANVQIVSGLNAGDTIVTTGLMSIKPDSKIEIKKVVNSKPSVESFKQ